MKVYHFIFSLYFPFVLTNYRSTVQDTLIIYPRLYNVTFLPFPFCSSAANLYRWPRNAILHDLSLLCKENVDRAEQLSVMTTDQRKYETPRFFHIVRLIKEKFIICMHTFMYIVHNI